MAKLTTAEFIAAIKELTVLELNELVKACEEEFGVSVWDFIKKHWENPFRNKKQFLPSVPSSQFLFKG